MLPDERYITTEQMFLDRMTMAMGGRAAEEIIFDHLSTGAQSDLEQITAMAYAMVVEFGMSNVVGHVNFNVAKRQEMQFYKPYSEKTAELIDAEVKRIVDEAHDRARRLLEEKDEEFNRVAEALLEREVLNENDLKELMGERPFKRPVYDRPATPTDDELDAEAATPDGGAESVLPPNGIAPVGGDGSAPLTTSGAAETEAGSLTADEDA